MSEKSMKKNSISGEKAPGDQKVVKERKKVNLSAALKQSYRLLRDGRLDEAENILDKIIKARPETAAAHNFLGMTWANREQFDKAIACYHRALEIDPGLADAHNNLGNVLRHLGRHEEAAACYEQVRELAPDNPVVRINQGKTLARMGKSEEAGKIFREILAADPDQPEAHRGMARLQQAGGDTEGAVKSFRRALELDPDSIPVLNELGILLENLEDLENKEKYLEEAVTCFRRAIEIRPDQVGNHINLANALRKQEKLDEAEAAARRAIEIDAEFPTAHNTLGIVFREMHREQDAVACFQRAVEINPDHMESHNNMGNALRHLGRKEEALAAYQRAIDIEPDFMEVYINRAKIHDFYDGDPELERLKGYLDREDLSGRYRNTLLFTLGKAHDDAGLYGEAFSWFEKGNEAKAQQEPYDAERHRMGVELLKRMFHRPIAASKNAPADSERIPVFIVGMSRSGKTLTESLLARCAEVYDAGERKEWSDAIDSVRKRYSISDPFPKCLDHMNGGQIREIGETYMQEVAKIDADSKYIINTLPGNYAHVGLIFLAFPHVRVIYCHRYPLDNFLQIYFYRYKHGNSYSYGFDRLISYYADYQNIMRHWFSLYGGRMLSVEYETTIRNPAETAKRVYDYCGLEFDPRSIMDMEFRSDEIGHWKNYEPYLGEVREALLRMIQEEKRVKAAS